MSVLQSPAMITPQAFIHLLCDSGMNERQIVDALREAGVQVTQATINRIRNGRIKRTSFDVGSGLKRLHDQRLVTAQSA